MKNGIEKRIQSRIPMCWPIVLMAPQGAIKGISENISLDGVLTLTSEPVETNDEVKITATLSKDNEMIITAKKIWSDWLLADDTIYYETGFCFTKLSQGNSEIIASLVEESCWA